MESFGAYLKAQRESKGIRLEEIASITKIHIHALEHLEAGRFHKLPPEPFIRGFIIAYAKYVGLDPQETVSHYAEAVAAVQPEPKERPGRPEAGKPARPETAATAPVVSLNPPPAQAKPVGQASGRPVPSANEIIAEPNALPLGKLVGAGAGIVALAIVVGLIYVGKQSSETTTVVVQQAPPAQETASFPPAEPGPLSDTAESVQPAESQPAQVAQTTRPGPIPPPGAGSLAATSAAPREAAAVQPKHKLVIQGKERTWLKVVVDDKAPLEYFLPKGQTVGYVANEKIKLVLGEAPNAAVFHNDQPVAGYKLRDNVSIFVFPSGAKFPQDAAARKASKPESAEETAEESRSPQHSLSQ